MKGEAGFSFIQFLIIAAILGIFALGLLTVRNPEEEVKKNNDTKIKRLSQEFQIAIFQYFNKHNALPWSSLRDGGQNCYIGNTIISNLPLSSLTECIQTLISEGDLDSEIFKSNYLSRIVIFAPTASPQQTKICFIPQSKLEQKNSETKYNQDGTIAANCVSRGGTGACYWCAQ